MAECPASPAKTLPLYSCHPHSFRSLWLTPFLFLYNAASYTPEINIKEMEATTQQLQQKKEEKNILL